MAEMTEQIFATQKSVLHARPNSAPAIRVPPSPRTQQKQQQQRMVSQGLALGSNWRQACSQGAQRVFTRPRPNSDGLARPPTRAVEVAAPRQESRAQAHRQPPPRPGSGGGKTPPRCYLPTVPASFTVEMMRARAVRELCSSSNWTSLQLLEIGFTRADLDTVGFFTPPSFRPLNIDEKADEKVVIREAGPFLSELRMRPKTG